MVRFCPGCKEIISVCSRGDGDIVFKAHVDLYPCQELRSRSLNLAAEGEPFNSFDEVDEVCRRARVKVESFRQRHHVEAWNSLFLKMSTMGKGSARRPFCGGIKTTARAASLALIRPAISNMHAVDYGEPWKDSIGKGCRFT